MSDQEEEGLKYDDGKPLIVRGALRQFDSALHCAVLTLRGEQIQETALLNWMATALNLKPFSLYAVVRWPHAMQRIAEVSEFGARKYAWDNWRVVEAAASRYTEALVRHTTATGYEKIDPESGFSHTAHATWNALALYEIIPSSEGAELAAAMMDALELEIIALTNQKEMHND